uniref:Uncharacterized protein n=1 Tax=Anguilla anguilla TaxID=7936 RepID=A0A0E9T1P2_ANGAN
MINHKLNLSKTEVIKLLTSYILPDDLFITVG